MIVTEETITTFASFLKQQQKDFSSTGEEDSLFEIHEEIEDNYLQAIIALELLKQRQTLLEEELTHIKSLRCPVCKSKATKHLLGLQSKLETKIAKVKTDISELTEIITDFFNKVAVVREGLFAVLQQIAIAEMLVIVETKFNEVFYINDSIH